MWNSSFCIKAKIEWVESDPGDISHGEIHAFIAYIISSIKLLNKTTPPQVNDTYGCKCFMILHRKWILKCGL